MPQRLLALTLICLLAPSVGFGQGKELPIGLMAPGAGLGSVVTQQAQPEPRIKTTIQPLVSAPTPINSIVPGSYEDFQFNEKNCKGGNTQSCVLAGLDSLGLAHIAWPSQSGATKI